MNRRATPLVIAALIACANPLAADEERISISGIVAIGAVSGATISAHRTDADWRLLERLAETQSDQQGQWTLHIPTAMADQPLLLQARGGHYSDPITGHIAPLTALYSALPVGARVAVITPVTSILIRRAQLLANAGDFEADALQFATALGFDPLRTAPATAQPDSASDEAAQRHAAVIGGISAIVGGSSLLSGSEAGQQASEALFEALIEDLTDGVLDGVDAADQPVLPGDGSHPLPVMESLTRPLLQSAIERYVAATPGITSNLTMNLDVWRAPLPAPDDSGPYADTARWRVDVSGHMDTMGNRHPLTSTFERLSGTLVPRPGEPLDCKRLRWQMGPNYSDMRSVYHTLECGVIGRYVGPPKREQGFKAHFAGKQLVSHGNALAEADFVLEVTFTWLR